MLSIGSMGSGQEGYYTNLAREDYYLAGGEPEGRWWGGGAEKLGLSGPVNAEELGALFRGYAPDGRKVKSTIHWVSADSAIDAEVRLYDRLFTIEDPAGQKDKDFKEFLNPDSLEVLKGCKTDPAIKNLKTLDRFQFERIGYFCIDSDTTKNKIVINKTIGLRDTWAKIQEKQK